MNSSIKKKQKSQDKEENYEIFDDSGQQEIKVEQQEQSQKKNQNVTEDSGKKSKHYTFQDDQYLFELTKTKKISVGRFKGNVLISLREYFDKDGKQLPTKKGITLSVEGWEQLKRFVDEVDECIQKQK